MSAQPALAPWLQTQLEYLLTQRGHAWLLSGPSGLGQFELALALAKAWLCDAPTAQGACGQCGSCHSVEVHTHPDLCMLMPEALCVSLGWPLDEKTEKELEKRKPSKEIKVDAAREAVSFTQFTRSRGNTKVVLVFPAERMNNITANTLLKTLEEPTGEVKFVLATEAAHQLLPTIRSRCLGHTMRWPDFEDSLRWLQSQTATPRDSSTSTKAVRDQPAASKREDLRVLLAGAGGRPEDALVWLNGGASDTAARQWQALPKAMARGDVSALSDWAPSLALDALQKLCHDMWVVKVGGKPRFFNLADLPIQTQKPAAGQGAELALPSASATSIFAMATWAKELATAARSVEHPYNPGLMLEAMVSRAKQALGTR
jgi:DNA polymerase-3 subunit delta'